MSTQNYKENITKKEINKFKETRVYHKAFSFDDSKMDFEVNISRLTK